MKLLKNILTSGGLMLLALSSNTANATLFNFSFNNVEGSLSGTVKGTIELADGDGTFAASSVFVTSHPDGLGYDPAGFNWAANNLENSFTVVAGEITAANGHFFGLFNTSTALSLNGAIGLGGSFLDALNAGNYGATGVSDANSSTLVFTSAAVPETDSMIGLLGLGLGILFTARSRK